MRLDVGDGGICKKRWITRSWPGTFASAQTRSREVSHRHRPLPALSGVPMNLHLSIGPLVSLLAGILILVIPRMLNYIVAIYLIVMGLLGLFGNSGLHLN
jgi:hypothetical protein